MILRFGAGATRPPERVEEEAIQGTVFKGRKASADANLRSAAFMKEQIRRIVFLGGGAQILHRLGE